MRASVRRAFREADRGARGLGVDHQTMRRGAVDPTRRIGTTSLPSIAMSAELCKPVRYADGDTFTFKRGNESVRVRLAGYDALERGQPFSKRATDRLRELTEGGAQCDCYKQDKYGRSVCTVRTRAGVNVATEMLKGGFACIDPRFESEAAPEDRAAARAALTDAQAQRRGMWSMPDPVCAADYRRAKNAQ